MADAEIDWGEPGQALRPVREYLAALEEADDPAASWTEVTGGPAFSAYSNDYRVDIEHGIIVDPEAKAVNKTAEAKAVKTMVKRVKRRSASNSNGWSAASIAARRRCLPGWWTRNRSPACAGLR